MFLIVAGSSQKNSLNHSLGEAVKKILEEKGQTASVLDWSEYPLPLLNVGHNDNSTPQAAKKLRQQFIEAEGVFILTPEYNGNLTPLLLNAIDWMANYVHFPDDTMLPFKNKVAAIASASPGHFGGSKALGILRAMLTHMGVCVCPQDLALGYAHKNLNNGDLIQGSDVEKQLHQACDELILHAKALNRARTAVSSTK